MDRATIACAVAAVLIFAAPGAAMPQQQPEGTVAGTVVSARNGNPVAGAQVSVQGTTHAVLSNNAGRFRIDGLTGDQVTLRVVMVGFRPVSQATRVGNDSVRVALEELPITIDELVVTGTPGATQKRALGNARRHHRRRNRRRDPAGLRRR